MLTLNLPIACSFPEDVIDRKTSTTAPESSLADVRPNTGPGAASRVPASAGVLGLGGCPFSIGLVSSTCARHGSEISLGHWCLLSRCLVTRPADAQKRIIGSAA